MKINSSAHVHSNEGTCYPVQQCGSSNNGGLWCRGIYFRIFKALATQTVLARIVVLIFLKVYLICYRDTFILKGSIGSGLQGDQCSQK